MYVATLLLTTVIALFVVADTTRSVAEINSAQLYEQTARAFHAAEGVVGDALSEFMDGGADATINFSASEGWQTAGGGTCSTSQPCERTVVLGAVTATVSVDNIGATMPTILAGATAGPVTRNLEVVIERPNTSPFYWPIFAEESIGIGSDVLIDSYSSNLGDYGVALDPADLDYGSWNKSQAGLVGSLGADMRTDSVDVNTVVLGNGTEVYGDVLVGEGGIPSVVIDGASATIHGAQQAAASNYEPPSVQLPLGAPSGSGFSLGNGESATVNLSTCNCSSITLGNDAQLTLTGSGTLHLSTVTVGKDATMDIQGADVTLVIDGLDTAPGSRFMSNAGRMKIYGTGNGSFNFAHESLMNPTQDPKALMFYLKGSNPLSIASASGFHGAIYAPDVDISVGADGIIHGSLVGKSVSVGSRTQVHYDEALQDFSVTIEQGPTLIRSWREIEGASD